MSFQRAKFKDLIFNWVKVLPDNTYIQARFNDSYSTLHYNSCTDLGKLLVTLKKDDFIDQLDLVLDAVEMADSTKSPRYLLPLRLELSPLYRTDEVFKAVVFDIDIAVKIVSPKITLDIDLCIYKQIFDVLEFLSSYRIELYRTHSNYLAIIPDLPVETYLSKFYSEFQWLEIAKTKLKHFLINVDFINGYHYRYHYVEVPDLNEPPLQIAYKRAKPRLIIQDLKTLAQTIPSDLCESVYKEYGLHSTELLRLLALEESETSGRVYEVTSNETLLKLVYNIRDFLTLAKLTLV